MKSISLLLLRGVDVVFLAPSEVQWPKILSPNRHVLFSRSVQHKENSYMITREALTFCSNAFCWPQIFAHRRLQPRFSQNTFRTTWELNSTRFTLSVITSN